MVDVRTLLDQAAQSVARATEPLARTAVDTAEMGASLAAYGILASESLAAAVGALSGKLRDIEVLQVQENLNDVSEHLTAISARLRRLSEHLGQASVRFRDTVLQESGTLMVDGFEAVAKLVHLLRPDETGVIRFIPGVVTRPYVDVVTRAELGLRAAADLVRICVNALPDIGEGLKDISEDLERAADLLETTAKTIRELGRLFPI
jgi:ABC-type transporter Mla subunit MlaD